MLSYDTTSFIIHRWHKRCASNRKNLAFAESSLAGFYNFLIGEGRIHIHPRHTVVSFRDVRVSSVLMTSSLRPRVNRFYFYVTDRSVLSRIFLRDDRLNNENKITHRASTRYLGTKLLNSDHYLSKSLEQLDECVKRISFPFLNFSDDTSFNSKFAANQLCVIRHLEIHNKFYGSKAKDYDLDSFRP